MKYLVLAIIAFAALMSPAVTRAQDATPVASPQAPSPDECVVAPITAERLNLIFAGASSAATPEAISDASPVASPTPFVMPEGTPADDATAAAVTAAVREYMSCINAGDVLRILSLYSDTGIRDLFADAIAQGYTGEQIVSTYGSPAPLADDQQTLLYGVDSIVVLSDGRVAALVVGDDLSKPNPPGPALMYFVQVDGTWLVDGFVPTEDIVTS